MVLEPLILGVRYIGAVYGGYAGYHLLRSLLTSGLLDSCIREAAYPRLDFFTSMVPSGFLSITLQLDMRFQAILIGLGAVDASSRSMRYSTNVEGSVVSEEPVAIMTLDRFRDIIDIVFRTRMSNPRLVECLKMVGDALIAVAANRPIRTNLQQCFQEILDPIISDETAAVDSSIVREWSTMSAQLYELMPPTTGSH